MVVKITGQITNVLPAQTGVSQRTGNPWMTQEYVMQHDNGQYPRFVSFKVSGQEKIAQFNIQVGQYITVSLDVNAHEYNGRWYNEISAFKVEYPGVQQQMPPQQQMQGGMQMPPMQGAMPPMQGTQQQMPPQGAMPPQQQGCQTYYQNGANQMGYNVPPQQGGMPPQQSMAQQAPPQQQAPFPPQQ